MTDKKPKKLRPSGGYRELRSFQVATIIYDATYWFCERFADQHSRMRDQMIQAARSGRQNIAEGSRTAAASSQTELRLINVARASLEELLLDLEDYLRHRRHLRWKTDSVEAVAVRSAGWRKGQDRSDPSDQSEQSDEARYRRYAQWLDHADPAARANAIICLIHQANYLLDQQIAALEADFISEGGYSEQLAVARLAYRHKAKAKDRPDQSDRSDLSDPKDEGDRARVIPQCPKCGGSMVLRVAKQGKNAGTQFLGCAAYPDCKGIANL